MNPRPQQLIETEAEPQCKFGQQQMFDTDGPCKCQLCRMRNIDYIFTGPEGLQTVRARNRQEAIKRIADLIPGFTPQMITPRTRAFNTNEGADK